MSSPLKNKIALFSLLTNEELPKGSLLVSETTDTLGEYLPLLVLFSLVSVVPILIFAPPSTVWIPVLVIVGVVIVKAGLTATCEIDIDKQLISIVRNIGNYRQVLQTMTFSDVEGFTVNYFISERKREPVKFNYSILLITKAPSVLRISSWREKGLDDCNLLAEKLAGVVDCNFTPGIKESIPRVLQNDQTGKLEVVFTACERTKKIRSYYKMWGMSLD